MGVTVLSALYGAVLLSSMLLPPLLIRILGCKWTIVASMCCYVTFSLGNFYASWYALPAAGPGPGLPGATVGSPFALAPATAPAPLYNELGFPRPPLGFCAGPC